MTGSYVLLRHAFDARLGVSLKRVLTPNGVFGIELLLLLAARIDDGAEFDLASALRSGDRMAFRAFFDRYHAELLRYLRYRNVDPDLAEDLVQQAFISVWERRESLRDDGSVRGLLFRVAYTRALNHFRDTARLDRLDDVTMGLAENGPDALKLAESRLIRERLSAVVATLPERRRAVFELCVLEGFTYRETAEALDISIKTVENQMAHALRAVREALSMHREDHPPGG